ncbi:TrbG/VirB9 family P-type conjugative transfer protein [Pseudomonas veronii]|uniref:TrbG/VirB9 family P-type conjugative transfer protein n=1 Tax=Pseudomonas veronii TaxID=76761 RepID=UPI0021C230C1|nr:TrbG/VirB9 family P-type conjugative transfer protein [Pseudomonas veronii]MCT9827403.1 TrbG/VirB9 family P-type conjugative transfer protein [Pseudomonas veronii]
MRFICALALTAVANLALAGSQLDYGYVYQSDSGVKPLWMPESIATDGSKTFVRFPKDVLKPLSSSALVALFNSEQARQWVYSIQGDLIVVDGVLENFPHPEGMVDSLVKGDKTYLRFRPGMLRQFDTPSLVKNGTGTWRYSIQGDLMVVNEVLQDAILIGPDGHERVFIKHQDTATTSPQPTVK